MHTVAQIGALVLAVAAIFGLLTVIALMSNLTYRKLPADRRSSLPRSSYNVYGRRWALFAKLTVAALVVGGVLIVLGLF